VLQRLRPRYDAGYHTAPIHPYFRDEQRVISDMRRLVFFVDNGMILGFESVPELVDIVRKLPIAKQTAIIRMAVAGSVANIAADKTMKYLRRRKLHFAHVEADRVLFRTSFQGVHLKLSRSLETQAMTLSLPALRTTYSYASHPKLLSHSLNFSPVSRLALSYIRWGELDIFSGSFSALGGFGLFSHDYTRKITLFGLRLARNQNWIGIFFMKYWRLEKADWLRLDIWLR
jgi:hypothetical protein